MYRLSIVVPRVGAVEPFEETLVSVLQNRPDRCEVLVPHAGPYEDPYQLTDEVRFIERAATADLTSLFNAGCRAAAGEFLHTLQPGMVVEEGWAGAALRGFAEPRVAAVAPLVLDAARPGRVLAAGIRYTASGSRVVHGRGARRERLETPASRPITGPWLAAAFYRRSTWQAAGGFCERIHPAWVDLELALILQQSGLRTELRTESVIAGSAACLGVAPSYRLGLSAERIYLRQSAASAGSSRRVGHILTACLGLLSRSWRPAAYAELFGRLAARLDRVERRHEQARLLRAEQALAAIEVPPEAIHPFPRGGQQPAGGRPGRAGRGPADRRASEAA